jgi:pectin methylesterase-like acyl-CoA thioesterase
MKIRGIFVIAAVFLLSALGASAQTIVFLGGTGTGHYTTLAAAVAALPSAGGEVKIEPGTYTGQATISKPNVWLVGQGTVSNTILTDNLSAAGAGSDQASSTVIVTKAATGFYASNITIQNTFGNGSQAVALFMQADESVLRNDNILGNQDTLYLGSEGCTGTTCTPARTYLNKVYVQGNVDFIFGDGAAVFDGCTIQIDENGSLTGETTVTAQNRAFTNYLSGYVFWSSTVRSNPATGETNDYLGRPWSALSDVTYINTNMTAPINKAGWIEWQPGTTTRLNTATYSEFGSTGAGAAGYTGKTRESHAIYLTSAQTAAYSPNTYLKGSNGWVPTSVTH